MSLTAGEPVLVWDILIYEKKYNYTKQSGSNLVLDGNQAIERIDCIGDWLTTK